MANALNTKLWKTFDWALCKTAGVTYNAVQYFNKFNPNPSFTPKWSDKPLLKSWEKSKPTLGWPRTTDSLCPDCVREARDLIINGKKTGPIWSMKKSAKSKRRLSSAMARSGW